MSLPSKDGLDDLSVLYRRGIFYILRSLQHLKSGVGLFATGELWCLILEHSVGIIFHSDQLELKGVVSHMTPCWKLNVGPLVVQRVLLATELSLQPVFLTF